MGAGRRAECKEIEDRLSLQYSEKEMFYVIKMITWNKHK